MDAAPYLRAESVAARPLSEHLLEAAGISPGMRVVVLGSGLSDLPFLVAERVGASGTVIAAGLTPGTNERARRRAADQCLDRIEFQPWPPKALDPLADAVVGRFFLMEQADPVSAIRQAAAHVRDGGRVVFHEWHYASVAWAETSHWPEVPLYRQFARWALAGLRYRGAHVDMGLRLPNAFAAAGLRLPTMRTDLRAIAGSSPIGYEFFQEAIAGLLPAIEGCGIATAGEVGLETLAQRLEQQSVHCGGHIFLPLQVGAFTRTTHRSL